MQDYLDHGHMSFVSNCEDFKPSEAYFIPHQPVVPRQHKNSKRNVLSKISQVYDPLGLVGPVLITGKLIMQQLWRREIGWDEELPSDLKSSWEDYCTSLPHINELKLIRNVNHDNYTNKFVRLWRRLGARIRSVYLRGQYRQTRECSVASHLC